jgi:PBP1b-binding outer membrane lipoprotein LpoB
MRPLSVLLIALLLTGCVNVMHPSPNAPPHFASMDQCREWAQVNNEDVNLCGKHIDAAHTGQAVAGGVLVALYVAFLVLLGMAASR